MGRIVLTVWLGLVLLLAARPAAAEDGYDLWLRYKPLEASWAQRYRPLATEIVAAQGSTIQTAATAELDRGLKGLLGRAPNRAAKVDRDGALEALHNDLQRALSDDEVERRRLSKALLPHVKAFYDGYFDPMQHQPFYRSSSRV